jgi:pimeloyl-ACP methyl ester carboxylesterase
MFTYFTDRDGKFQLNALAESGFDPLARTTKFMLTEEAHHMFVGETGIARILERTCQLMKQAGYAEDVRRLGGIDLPTLVVHGTADRLIKVENGKLIARLIPAPIELLEDVGHMFWWEQPERSAELIREHALTAV